MTKVMARRVKDRYEIVARGHATGSVAGCAYISGILQSVAGYIENAMWIQVNKCRLEPGDVALRFRGGANAQAAYELAVIGLKQLEESHPDLIRVEEK